MNPFPKLLVGLLLTFAPFAAHATTYYFYQSGFNGGGYFSGTTESSDVDADGIIWYDGGQDITAEVSAFDALLTGNSIIGNTQFSALVTLSHTVGATFMYAADREYLNTEGNSGGATIEYITNTTAFSIYDASAPTVIASTTNPIMFSTSPITQDSYDAALQSVPEPSAFALLTGAVPLALWIRRKFNKAA